MSTTTTTTTTTALKVPKSGPADPRVYLVLLSLVDCDRAAIDAETGEVWVGNTADRVRWTIDPAHLDTLIELKWVDDGRAHDELHVTPQGHYWLSRFLKLNGGR